MQDRAEWEEKVKEASTGSLFLCSCPSLINVGGGSDGKKLSSAPWIPSIRLGAGGMS